MPAEWAAHDAVWLQWPTERMRGYPGYAVKLESIWLEMTRVMHTDGCDRHYLPVIVSRCPPWS
jgi:hypothetical protein